MRLRIDLPCSAVELATLMQAVLQVGTDPLGATSAFQVIGHYGSSLIISNEPDEDDEATA
jgi:hypothetical protein